MLLEKPRGGARKKPQVSQRHSESRRDKGYKTSVSVDVYTHPTPGGGQQSPPSGVCLKTPKV